MKHTILFIIIGILGSVSSCSCGPPRINTSTLQQWSQEYKVYIDSLNQLIISRTQAKLRLLNELIGEAQDSIAFLYKQKTELADSLLAAEQTGAYIALKKTINNFK